MIESAQDVFQASRMPEHIVSAPELSWNLSRLFLVLPVLGAWFHLWVFAWRPGATFATFCRSGETLFAISTCWTYKGVRDLEI